LAGVAEEVEVVNQDGAGGGDAWSSGRTSAGRMSSCLIWWWRMRHRGCGWRNGSRIWGPEERRRDLGADWGWVRLREWVRTRGK